MLWAALRDGGHPCVVSYGRVHGPLTGAAQVAKSRVEPGALSRPRKGVIGSSSSVPPLVVRVVVLLCPGDRWVRGGGGAVVLQVEGAESDVLGGALLLTVVTGTQLLCLDLGPVLPLSCF